jgi:hypothetical protein
VTNHLHLAPRLALTAAIPLLPPVSSWHVRDGFASLPLEIRVQEVITNTLKKKGLVAPVPETGSRTVQEIFHKFSSLNYMRVGQLQASVALPTKRLVILTTDRRDMEESTSLPGCNLHNSVPWH